MNSERITVERNTILLQAAAALLIANSHLERFYPHPWMAADGFIGNSIFFFLSGYGVALSLRDKPQDFISYYSRRILRIYPTVWITQVVFYLLLQGYSRTAGPWTYLRLLVYPTEYGYVQQIMVFYVLFYALKRPLKAGWSGRLIVALFVPLLALFAYDFVNNPVERLQLGNANIALWWVFFFQAMLLGAYMALHSHRAKSGIAGPAIAFALCLALYVILKFLMVFGVAVPLLNVSLGRYYILLHLLMLPLIGFGFLLAISDPVLAGLRKWKPAALLSGAVGAMTLEVYTVHSFVMEQEWVRNLKFPINIVVFFGVTLALAALVFWTAGLLRAGLRWVCGSRSRISGDGTVAR